jgi:hypothetical protein
MVGRGTRPLGGVVDGIDDAAARRAAIAASPKTRVEVLDFVGNAGRHKLMTTADVLGGKYSDEVVNLANRKARESKQPVDMGKLLKASEEELERRRQDRDRRSQEDAATRAALVGKASYSTSLIDAFNVFDITPAQSHGWDTGRRPTAKMVEVLRRLGVEGAADLRFAQAGQLIEKLTGRRRDGLCTLKQAKKLKQFGYSTDVSFEEANRLIDAIAANGWRRPPSDDALVGAAEGEL